MNIYLIGSLRNPEVPHIANQLRGAHYEVYDDWFSDGKIADEEWYRYEQKRGRNFQQALTGHHAKQVFEFDLRHLSRADVVVLVAPAGRSAHLELGWALGQGKPGYILLDKEPERYDIMYRFAAGLAYNVTDLLTHLALEEHKRYARERAAETALRYATETLPDGNQSRPQAIDGRWRGNGSPE